MTGALAAFALAALAIAVAGTFLSILADRLADRTGMGEALTGMLVLAAATSLPDLAATLSASLAGRPTLAMANVMGSMAINLAFLGIGDLIYRKANLEHAAASAPNLLQVALLIVLLTIPLLATVFPPLQVLGVHPATPLLLVAYLYGIRLVRGAHARPMWRPLHTRQTVADRPDEAKGGRGVLALWLAFAGLAAVTAGAGWVLMESAQAIVDATGISDSVAGGLLTAAATSTPELVVTIAAVRRGALTLAVANIFGSNCFNATIIAAADLAYPGGSIYRALPVAELGWGLVAILMSAILLLGMLRREPHGIANIGFESFAMLLVYGAAVAIALLR